MGHMAMRAWARGVAGWLGGAGCAVGLLALGCGDTGSPSGPEGTTSGAVGGQGAQGGLGGQGGQAGGGTGGAGGEAGGGNAGGSGPSACEQACAKYGECSLPDLCGQAGEDCAPPSFSDCLYNCVASSDCAELAVWPNGSAPALNACVGACDGGQACLDCAATSIGAGQPCEAAVAACAADATCSSWASCIAVCSDAVCYSNCDVAYPAAAPLFDPVYTCFCAQCGEICGTVMGPCLK